MKKTVILVAIFAMTIAAAVATPSQLTLGESLPSLQDTMRSKRSYDKWLDIIAQYARRGADGSSAFQPFPVDLPIGGKDGKQTTLPLLVLPFPVPVPATSSKQECTANNDRDSSNRQRDSYRYNEDRNKGDRFREDRYREDRNREDRYKEDRFNEYRNKEDRNREDKNREYRNREDRYKENRYKEDRNREDRFKQDRYKEDRYKEERNREDRFKEDKNRFKEDRYENRNYDVRFGDTGVEKSYDSYEKKGSVTSDYLIEVFKKQQPTAPELPPALIDYAPEITSPSITSAPRGFTSSSRQYLPPARDDAQPSPPKFDRSMVVRGFLTVHKADYTEAYTARYDARTGSSRVDYHEGGTTSFCSMTSDNRVKRMVMSTDRTGERDVVVCGETAARRASPEDREPPMFPNTEGFSFAGTKEEFGVRAEVWKRELRGREGEGGAARGEALVHRHELLVHKRDDGFSVPLRYKVAVDSSVLGKDCDGYEHVYSEVREKDHDEDEFRFNTDRECDVVDKLDANNPDDMARLDPVREFTLPQRDPRYDVSFESYTKQFERTYIDHKEEALRKNLLVQHTRFISSCNRQSATFSLEVNFLSDRLDEELEGILGVSFSSDAENNTASFPLREDRIDDIQRKLPEEFDWRSRGAVSPVKFQGASCSSCWAFAVAGSVEGALFVKTQALVELSVQALVDCAVSHGAHGCNKIGTWPVHAFNYIKDRGIPANDEYTPYDAMDHKCQAPPSTPVTHIQGGADVPPNNIEALKVAIRRFAPAVVVVDAKPQTFISYKKGVLRDDRCIKNPKKKLNHAVLAVGWGEQRGAPHFIVKNSWSTAWGDAGYIRLHAPTNTCGHLTTPSFALLRRAPGGARGRGADSGEEDYDDRR